MSQASSWEGAKFCSLFSHSDIFLLEDCHCKMILDIEMLPDLFLDITILDVKFVSKFVL